MNRYLKKIKNQFKLKKSDLNQINPIFFIVLIKITIFIHPAACITFSHFPYDYLQIHLYIWWLVLGRYFYRCYLIKFVSLLKCLKWTLALYELHEITKTAKNRNNYLRLRPTYSILGLQARCCSGRHYFYFTVT